MLTDSRRNRQSRWPSRYILKGRGAEWGASNVAARPSNNKVTNNGCHSHLIIPINCNPDAQKGVELYP